MAAALSGRNYLAIELDAEYCEVARRRLGGVSRYVDRTAGPLSARAEAA